MKEKDLIHQVAAYKKMWEESEKKSREITQMLCDCWEAKSQFELALMSIANVLTDDSGEIEIEDILNEIGKKVSILTKFGHYLGEDFKSEEDCEL